MKNNLKRLAVFGLVAISLVATGCGCSKDEKDNNKKQEGDTTINTSQDVIKDQEFEGLKMENTSLVMENGRSTLVTEVTNNTGADYYLQMFTITVKDSDGKVITTLPGYAGDVIRNGETKVINSSTDRDLTNAASIEYSVTK